MCYLPPANKLTGANASGNPLSWQWVDYIYLADGQPVPAAVPEDATALITSYFADSQQLPNPQIHVGPVPEEVAVKVPMWMWVADPQVEPLVVDGFLVSVTATPTVASTTWQTNEPVEHPDKVRPYWFHEPTVCDGLGSQPPPLADRNSEPPCGYTFRWRSTAERTDYDCAWSLTATITWTIPWTATTGQSGTLTAETSTVTWVRVGEWRTVLVSDPNWEPPPEKRDPRCRH